MASIDEWPMLHARGSVAHSEGSTAGEPQYWVQKNLHVPVWVAWNQSVEYMPGTTSRLRRNAGT